MSLVEVQVVSGGFTLGTFIDIEGAINNTSEATVNISWEFSDHQDVHRVTISAFMKPRSG